jgi:uracil-DNA glycosylase
MSPKSLIDESWKPILHFLDEEPLLELNTKILPNVSYQPESCNIFRVFSMPIKDVKVVILGQDPYPTPGNAVGLSFVNGIVDKIPTSLRNIYKEINNCGYENSDIQKWFEQGVFLMNTALTVETGNAGSHIDYWKYFSKEVIKYLSRKQSCIWLLWGKHAQSFLPYIYKARIVNGYTKDNISMMPLHPDWNYVFTSAHPAAEAYSGGKAGFFGSNHFLFTNTILERRGLQKINW